MQVANSREEAFLYENAIYKSTEYLWHDEIENIDDDTTLTINSNLKKMYQEEQSVTQLIIDDLIQEGKNLEKIAGKFNEVDRMMAALAIKL